MKAEVVKCTGILSDDGRDIYQLEVDGEVVARGTEEMLTGYALGLEGALDSIRGTIEVLTDFLYGCECHD